MEKDQGRELISKSYPVPHHCAKTMITQAANKIQPSTVRGRREKQGFGTEMTSRNKRKAPTKGVFTTTTTEGDMRAVRQGWRRTHKR